MSEENHKVIEEKQPKSKTRSQGWLFLRRDPAILDPIRRFYEPTQRIVGPYIKNGHVVADLGCGSGYYTFAMAKIVGPEGKVYAVDLGNKAIKVIDKKIEKGGYKNIEAHASSAADVSFIKNSSVDFVLANGLLCSMYDQRQQAVSEIKRILKPRGKAYISLGATPPLGFVNQAEWEEILAVFKVELGGSFKEKWAVVSLKQ